MTSSNFKTIMAGLVILFLICFMNTCNSCSSSRKIDDLSSKMGNMERQHDSIASKQSAHLELRLDMLQPQIVNQFLMMFNSEKYKSEIELNGLKIDALRQQIKTLEEKNDTTKTHRP